MLSAISIFLSMGLSAASIETLAGNGVAGFSEIQVNNPFGLAIGPDNALYFCEIGNHCIRRLDLRTRAMTRVVGTGIKGNSGDGGLAVMAAVNEPYEVRFDRTGNLFFVDMPSHVVRRVERNTGTISLVAGTGEAGFSGDGKLAVEAQLRQPHSITFAPDGALLICDIGNRRIRRVDLESGVITTFAGDGTREGLDGPRAIDFDADGNLYLALREGNAIVRMDRASREWRKLPIPVSGPKGLSYSADGALYIADAENHRIVRYDLKTGLVSTEAGTGQRGDGPAGDPLKCKLSRPHGIYASADGNLYVGDSESHRVRRLVYSDHGRTR